MRTVLRAFIIVSVACLSLWEVFRQLEAQERGRITGKDLLGYGMKTQETAVPIPEEQQQHLLEIFGRNIEELEKNPDVLGIIPSPRTGEILIVSDRPEGVPRTVEGIPVKVLPPPPHLPPPPGVIVLQPGGVIERREDLDACPEGFKEETKYRWRFCQPLIGNPEPIPGHLLNPPIAGIPYEEAEKIFERNADWLSRVGSSDGSRVNGVGLGAEGIIVETNTPALVPSGVEGVPVKVIPPRGEIRGSNHTLGTPIRPIHGGVIVIDPAWSVLNGGTAGAVVLSQGKPWMISAAHNLNNCENTVPCTPCDLPQSCPAGYKQFLNECPHYSGETLRQPGTTPPGPVTNVGQASRWTRIVPGATISDVMAFFPDSDTVDGNGSFSVDRSLESLGTLFLGTEATPVFNDPVVLVSGIADASNNHLFNGFVLNTAYDTPPAISNCASGNHFRVNQLDVSMPGVPDGASGGLILDSQRRVVSMLNWARLEVTPEGEMAIGGGGTKTAKLKAVLGFDAFYGTQTVPDTTIGVFRPGTHEWFLDNGSTRFGGCGSDLRYYDTCLGTFGSNGEKPVVGNWTGRGVYTVGQYRIGVFSPAINGWILDSTGNGTYDDCNLPTGDWCPRLSISQPTDLPVVGDWNGDGKLKLGQFRPSTAQWFLDWNGNGVWNGCTTDRCYTFGLANDKPVVGDWGGSSNNNRTKIGVFRNGTWFLDVNGSGAYGTGDRSFAFGIATDTPVVGNWSGTPKSKVGVFRYEVNGQGTWFLDGDGSETFSGCAIDGCYIFGDQPTGDVPVIWGPSFVRAN